MKDRSGHQKIQIVYLAHSSETIYWRTAYAVLSCLAYVPAEGCEIVLYTDNPDFFAPLVSSITVRVLAPADIHRWVEEAKGYKNVVKAEIFGQLTQSFIFVDSDTVWVKPFEPLFSWLTPETSLMQEREYRLAQRAEFQPLIDDPAFPEFTVDTWMYNSGILGVYQDNLDLIRSVKQRVLELLAVHNVRTPEQLLDGCILSAKTRILTAPSYIYHYWQDKGFADHLIESTIKQPGLEAALQKVIAGDGASLFPLAFRRYHRLYGLYMRFMAKWERLTGRG